MSFWKWLLQVSLLSFTLCARICRSIVWYMVNYKNHRSHKIYGELFWSEIDKKKIFRPSICLIYRFSLLILLIWKLSPKTMIRFRLTVLIWRILSILLIRCVVCWIWWWWLFGLKCCISCCNTIQFETIWNGVFLLIPSEI